MPRRGQISKRDVLPDPLYNSKLVTKLINNIMYDGKKGVAQRIVYDAFAMIEAKSGENALDVFVAALENVTTILAFVCAWRALIRYFFNVLLTFFVCLNSSSALAGNAVFKLVLSFGNDKYSSIVTVA